LNRDFAEVASAYIPTHLLLPREKPNQIRLPAPANLPPVLGKFIVPVCVQSRVDWQELVGNSKLLQDQLTLHRKSRWNTTAAGTMVCYSSLS
jgi:hypothetical protein